MRFLDDLREVFRGERLLPSIKAKHRRNGRCRADIGYGRCFREDTPEGHPDGMHDSPYAGMGRRGASWAVDPGEKNYLDPRLQRTC